MGPTIHESLAPGEVLLWEGYPRRGLILGAEELFAIPAGIVMLVVARFIAFDPTPGVATSSAIFLLTAPVFLAGLYLIFGAALARTYQRNRTHYAVTDRRVIIRTGGRHMRAWALTGLRELNVAAGRDGSGTITFTIGKAARFVPRRFVERRFEKIAAAADVYRLIREARRAAYAGFPAVARPADLDAPEAIAAEKRPVGLWLGSAAMTLVALASIAVFAQPWITALVPQAVALYRQAHFTTRGNGSGFGLVFSDCRAAGTFINNTKVMVVICKIANKTDDTLALPQVRLALFAAQTVVQEKVVDPPKPQIGPHGTVLAFVQIDEPDARAERYEMSFAWPARSKSPPP